MRLPLPVRLAAAIAVCAVVEGCGQSSPQAARDATSPEAAHTVAVQTPRAFELSTNLRPLASVQDDARGTDSAAYTESSKATTSSPRIREISATPDSTARGLIREPGAPPAEVHEPAPLAHVAQRPRNSYVPLAMPRIEPPAPAMQPHLAATPEFNQVVEKQPALALGKASPAPASKVPQYRMAAVTQPATPTTPAAPAPTANSPRIQAVTLQVQEISAQAVLMAQRGMLFSARAELLKALQLVAQTLDAQQATTAHAGALSAGLTALDEAGEFHSLHEHSTAVRSVAMIASRHRTPVFRGEHSTPVSPIAAQQQYLAYAQSQLAIAAGGLPVASQTLYQLGRLHTGMSTTQADPEAMHVPRAMVFHQAALATDPTNHLAANELGVLLARCGQLAEARTLLVQSVSIRPHAEAWHNLAVVHRRLGEADLAKRAEHERDVVGRQVASDIAVGDRAVRWVDAKSFAESAAHPPAHENAEQNVARAASSQRR